MSPTDELRSEHRAVETLLDVMGRICTQMESRLRVDVGDLQGILEFFQVFVDKCHHGKEEDLLFKAMEAVGVPRHGGPIGVMLDEHERGRRLVRAMSQAVEQYARGDDSAVPDFIRDAAEYAELLRQHIFKEDNVLYPMADKLLENAAQRQLSEGFEQIEREQVGPGKHEEFHRMLDRLKTKYVR